MRVYPRHWYGEDFGSAEKVRNRYDKLVGGIRRNKMRQRRSHGVADSVPKWQSPAQHPASRKVPNVEKEGGPKGLWLRRVRSALLLILPLESEGLYGRSYQASFQCHCLLRLESSRTPSFSTVSLCAFLQ